MRVVFATGIYPPEIGGPATYVKNLATALHERGHEVEVVTYGQGPGQDAFPVRRVPRRGPIPLRYGRYLRAVGAAARRADVVYLQDPLSAGLPGLLAARMTRVPAVVKVVGDAAWEVATGSGWVRDEFEDFQARTYGLRVELTRHAQRWVVKHADAVVVPSEYLRRTVARWGGSPESMHVIRNSLPEDTAPAIDRAAARRELGIADPALVALSAGRLVPWKGFDLLIRTVAALRPRLPELRAVVVGAGPSLDALRALARELGVSDAVAFTGGVARDRFRLYLHASDVFVLLSRYEGFPHVVLEAMQAGTPVLAAAAGGTPELVEDRRTGRLVDVAEPHRVEEVLAELCGDAAQRRRLADEARRRLATLPWEATVARTLAVLEGVAR
jgi:glycosyltransferase involved in cell wall biosynthesis